MEDYLKEFYQELNSISKEIEFDNVINDDGDPIPLNPKSYKGKVYIELKDKLKGFEDYAFIEYDQSAIVKHELPATRFYGHDKKVLICTSGEAKFHSMHEIKSHFHHVFANYYWDEEGVTSLPLGYFAYHEDNYIPSKERLHNIHFVACLNKHRIALASALTKIPEWLIFLGMHTKRFKTLKYLNAFAKLFPGNTIQFNHEFNAGLNSQTYCNTLRNTKIVLAPRGWINSETFRMYEAMQYGCVVFCDKLPDREYYKDIPVIQVDNWKDGLKKAKGLLKDQDYLSYLSEKNRKFYEEKLSPQATAKIIIDKLTSK